MRIQKGRFRGLVTAMPASALVLLGAGCSKTKTTELSTQGIYAVLEVTPLRGTAPEGGRVGPVRVMVVDPRIDAPAGKQLEAEGFPTDCPAAPSPCDSVALERGGLVLRAPGTHVLDPGALASWEVGDEKVVRGTQLSFTTLDRGPVLTLSGPEAAPAEARAGVARREWLASPRAAAALRAASSLLGNGAARGDGHRRAPGDADVPRGPRPTPGRPGS
jgi:hypothetical protein